MKKAYLCDSKIKKIKTGDVLLFYLSKTKKAVTTIGIVDAVFNKFDDFDDMYRLVRKRTAYNINKLKESFRNDKLVILFKFYYSIPKYVTYDFLKRLNIIAGSIQTITEIDLNNFNKILNESEFEIDKYIIE